MRTIGRLLVILAAALVIFAATLAFVEQGWADGLDVRGGAGGRALGTTATGQRGSSSGDQGSLVGNSLGLGRLRRFTGQGSGLSEGGLDGVPELLNKLMVMGAITLVVVVATKAREAVRGRWRRRQPAPA
jgi:hypothetical protein